MYLSAEGVLLHRAASGEWGVLPRRALVHPGEEVASPEPFESVLQFVGLDGELALSGGRARVLPTPPEVDAAVELVRGRLLMRRSPLAAPDRPLRLQLLIAGRAYRVVLTEPGTVCGIDLRWQPSSAGPEIPQTPRADGELHLLAGKLEIQSAAGGAWTLGPAASTLAFSNGQPVNSPQSLTAPPEWLSAPTGAAAGVARQQARQFEEAFDLTQPVSASIPALVEHKSPRVAELATGALALVDDYRALVRALSSPHQEARQAAILGLGVWLRELPEHGPQLQAEVDRYFQPEAAQKIDRLLWGYSLDDGRNPDLSSQLIDALGDAQIAVRELAFLQIRRLVGGSTTYRYHPAGTESQRAASIRQWRTHLQKEGALVPPGGAAASPAALQSSPLP